MIKTITRDNIPALKSIIKNGHCKELKEYSCLSFGKEPCIFNNTICKKTNKWEPVVSEAKRILKQHTLKTLQEIMK